MVNHLKNAFDKLDMQIRYYQKPPIEKLSEFHKGVHEGRAEGLLMASGILKTGVIKLMGEALEQQTDET